MAKLTHKSLKSISFGDKSYTGKHDAKAGVNVFDIPDEVVAENSEVIVAYGFNGDVPAGDEQPQQ